MIYTVISLEDFNQVSTYMFAVKVTMCGTKLCDHDRTGIDIIGQDSECQFPVSFESNGQRYGSLGAENIWIKVHCDWCSIGK